MTKTPRLHTMTDQDIDALDKTALREMLRHARNAAKQKRADRKAETKARRAAAIHQAVAVPFLTTLIQALAEQAGEHANPKILPVLDALGKAAHGGFEGVPLDPISLGNREVNPRSGDAVMALSAPLHDAVLLLSDPVFLVRVPDDLRAPIATLVQAVHTGLAQAIANGFMERGLAAPTLANGWRKATGPHDMDTIADRLYEITTDLEIGMIILRQDLRATMYRDLLNALIDVRIEAHKIAENAAPIPSGSEKSDDPLSF